MIENNQFLDFNYPQGVEDNDTKFEISELIDVISKKKRKRDSIRLVVINEEQLIKQVEIRPILYDKSLRGYRKSALREENWSEIAINIGATVQECRRRWRSLRDSFSKHYKEENSDTQRLLSFSTKKKKWVFFEQMRFIAPFLDFTNSLPDSLASIQDNSHESFLMSEDKNVSVETIEFDNSDDVSHFNGIDEDYEEKNTFLSRMFDCSTIYHSPKPTSNDAIINNNISPPRVENSQIQIASPLQVPIIEPTSVGDADERFLLSCLPNLKRLPAQKNCLARLKIQQILYNIEFGDDGLGIG